MLVDAHAHVWRAVPNYPEPAATTVSPVSDVPVEVLDEYLTEYGVDRAVLVQPVYPGEDNGYVADCAARRPERYAAVCVVDPRTPAAADRLAYWVQERGCKGLRLRPRIAAEAACFGDSSAFPLWERAAALGVVITIMGGPENLPALAGLLERFPTVTVVVDHMGLPAVSEGITSPAFRALLELARFPGAYIKVSGQGYYSRQPYPYPDCNDLIRAVYDRFGPARLVWGSDFPHILLKIGYRRALLLPQRAYPFLQPAELEQLLGGNAARLYWR
jgi:predicted TIM-barrel fold metal-dependent hydrolase